MSDRPCGVDVPSGMFYRHFRARCLNVVLAEFFLRARTGGLLGIASDPVGFWASTEATLKILLADDDEAYARQLAAMIQRDGTAAGQRPMGSASAADLVIDRVTDIDQVVLRLVENVYDVCFVGDICGGKSGAEVLSAVEKLDLRTALIFLTATADRATAYMALRYGAMDYLIKSALDSFGLSKSLAFSLFRKSKELSLRGAALHDSLTGLGNRVLFREQATKLLQQAQRARDQVAVIFMDVDGLKPVNDTYGHGVGDEVLRLISGRLVERTRKSDIVARVGGDEFMALLGKIDGPKAVAQVAEDLTKAISQGAFRVANHDIRVGLSCGTALFPDDSDDIDDLIRLADLRMYEVKVRNKESRRGTQMNWMQKAARQ